MDPKQLKRMQARKSQGLTYREIAEEHGTSKSTAHRKMKDVEKAEDND